MEKMVQAVYEQGVLRPLEPIALEERQEVTVTISDEETIAPDHPLLVSSEEWADAATDDISLDEVRRALSTIRGSLSEAVIEERRDRWVPRYFLDTSALVKVYRKELGSDLVAAINDQHFRSARQLLVDHGITEALRAPDALQLSVALGLKRPGLSVFVAADQKLCRVAAMEGFITLNPEQPVAL
jgi:predicted DNA-binding antitoxin AbrB/MazE fold protein/predicted nucleic acid-binding protein